MAASSDGTNASPLPGWRRIGKAWPCAASAFLLLMAFPPFHLSLLVFIALAPWLMSLREPKARAFRSGYGFGMLYMLGQMWWEVPFVSRWTGSVWLAFIPWILSGFLTATYFGIAGWLINICWKRKWAWAIPLVWVGMEVFRSYIPVLAFPWGLVATPLSDFPSLMGLGHFGMIYLASAWCLVVNVLLARVLAGEAVLKLRTEIALVIVGSLGTLLYWLKPIEGDVKTIVVGQPGEDLAFGDPATADIRLGNAIKPIIAAARGADLLVLPEGVAGVSASMPPSAPFDMDPQVPVLFGGERGQDPRYQTAFAYDHGNWSYADKTRLVIFGEFVPGRTWIPFMKQFRLPTGDLTAAEHVKALDVNGIRVGPMLCFEGLFPDVAYRQSMNGAEMIAIMAIDDWYMGSAAPQQLAAAASWRAVETGLPVVRSASMGITLACNMHGEVVSVLPIGASRGLSVKLVVPRKNTETRFGWAFVFPIVSSLSLVAVPIANRLRRGTQVPLP